MLFILLLLISTYVFLLAQKTLPSFSMAKKIKQFFYSTLCIGVFFSVLQWLYHDEVSNFWIFVTIGSFMIYLPLSLYIKQQFWSVK